MELALRNTSVIHRFMIFVGVAQFDEIEGPIISSIYPPDFPLDIRDNYMIADHSLHMLATTYFELNEYNIISIPIKINDKNLPRRVEYYAIIIGTKQSANINIFNHIDSIKILVNELLILNKIAFEHKKFQPLLHTLYDKIHELISQTDKNANPENPQKLEVSTEINPEKSVPIIVIDKLYGLIITNSPGILSRLKEKNNNVKILETKRYIVIIHDF